jgi:DNA-directed RNA polymerase specialized sigma24 family protein
MSVQFQSKTGESRQLSHPDPIKEQLAQAHNMGSTELLLWVTGENEALEPLAVETAISLIRKYRVVPEKTAIVTALVAVVQNKIEVVVAQRRRRLPRSLSIQEISDDLSSRVWTHVFAENDPWPEICFWQVLSHLLTDLVRDYRKQKADSIDSNRDARVMALGLPADGLALEVTVELRLRLMRLGLNQRRACWLRFGYGLSLGEAALILHRTPRSVANLVKAAKRQIGDQ